MKRQMQTFIRILLLTAVILFAGCNRKKVEQPEQVDTPTITQLVQLSEKAQSETVPTTLYPPKNLYEHLTVTGTKPSPDYVGGIKGDFLWIPEFEYEWENEELPEATLPVAPNHAEKWARFEKRYREAWYELRQMAEDVTSEKLRDDMIRETEMQLDNLHAEIMTEGMSPLNAAKYLMAHDISTEHRRKYAQQAVDENPNDYHTQLIWTWAQYGQTDYGMDKVLEGYRRLLEIRPNSAYALYNVGRFTYSADAIPLLKKAYIYAPDARPDLPLSLKVPILLELAKAYYKWHSDEAEAEAKALETLRHLSKYNPTLAQECITQLQTEKRIGRHSRPYKEKTQ